MDKNFRKAWTEYKARFSELKTHWIPIVGGFGSASGIFYLQQTDDASMYSYLVSLPAYLLIIITALARVNDIRPTQASKRWQFRRFGLSLVAAACGMFALMPFGEVPRYPTWLATGFTWGLAFSWLTTPNMPPWWRYIAGKDD
jgi:hypothetical protein